MVSFRKVTSGAYFKESVNRKGRGFSNEYEGIIMFDPHHKDTLKMSNNGLYSAKW